MRISDWSSDVCSSDLEVAQCSANGVTNIIELKVGVDGLAVATGKATQFPGLTTADIYKALAANPFGKPQTAKTWKDVNPALPAVAIRRSEEHTSELQSPMRIS